MFRGGGSHNSRGASGGRGRGGHHGNNNRGAHANEAQVPTAYVRGGGRGGRDGYRGGRGQYSLGPRRPEQQGNAPGVAGVVNQFQSLELAPRVPDYFNYVEGQKHTLMTFPDEILINIIEKLKVNSKGEDTVRHLLSLSRVNKKLRELIIDSPGCLFESINLPTHGPKHMVDTLKRFMESDYLLEHTV